MRKGKAPMSNEQGVLPPPAFWPGCEAFVALVQDLHREREDGASLKSGFDMIRARHLSDSPEVRANIRGIITLTVHALYGPKVPENPLAFSLRDDELLLWQAPPSAADLDRGHRAYIKSWAHFNRPHPSQIFAALHSYLWTREWCSRRLTPIGIEHLMFQLDEHGWLDIFDESRLRGEFAQSLDEPEHSECFVESVANIQRIKARLLGIGALVAQGLTWAEAWDRVWDLYNGSTPIERGRVAAEARLDAVDAIARVHQRSVTAERAKLPPHALMAIRLSDRDIGLSKVHRSGAGYTPMYQAWFAPTFHVTLGFNAFHHAMLIAADLADGGPDAAKAYLSATNWWNTFEGTRLGAEIEAMSSSTATRGTAPEEAAAAFAQAIEHYRGRDFDAALAWSRRASNLSSRIDSVYSDSIYLESQCLLFHVGSPEMAFSRIRGIPRQGLSSSGDESFFFDTRGGAERIRMALSIGFGLGTNTDFPTSVSAVHDLRFGIGWLEILQRLDLYAVATMGGRYTLAVLRLADALLAVVVEADVSAETRARVATLRCMALGAAGKATQADLGMDRHRGLGIPGRMTQLADDLVGVATAAEDRSLDPETLAVLSMQVARVVMHLDFPAEATARVTQAVLHLSELTENPSALHNWAAVAVRTDPTAAEAILSRVIARELFEPTPGFDLGAAFAMRASSRSEFERDIETAIGACRDAESSVALLHEGILPTDIVGRLELLYRTREQLDFALGHDLVQTFQRWENCAVVVAQIFSSYGPSLIAWDSPKLTSVRRILDRFLMLKILHQSSECALLFDLAQLDLYGLRPATSIPLVGNTKGHAAVEPSAFTTEDYSEIVSSIDRSKRRRWQFDPTLLHPQFSAYRIMRAEGTLTASYLVQQAFARANLDMHLVVIQLLDFSYSGDAFAVCTTCGPGGVSTAVGPRDLHSAKMAHANLVRLSGDVIRAHDAFSTTAVTSALLASTAWLEQMLAPCLPNIEDRDVRVIIIPYGRFRFIPVHTLFYDGVAAVGLRPSAVTYLPDLATLDWLSHSPIDNSKGEFFACGYDRFGMLHLPITEAIRRACAACEEHGWIPSGQQSVDRLSFLTDIRRAKAAFVVAHGQGSSNPMRSRLMLKDDVFAADLVGEADHVPRCVFLAACEASRQGVTAARSAEKNPLALDLALMRSGVRNVVAPMYMVSAEHALNVMLLSLRAWFDGGGHGPPQISPMSYSHDSWMLLGPPSQQAPDIADACSPKESIWAWGTIRVLGLPW